MKSFPRKICVVTSTRAEYGLLYWLMRAIKEDPDLTLQVIVTGTHLSYEFGYTLEEIERDGFQVDEKIEIVLSSDSAVGVAKMLGLATLSFAESFARLCPDILVILGDRCEMLAIAQAAFLQKISIAHIHGGEVTHGALDESIRHAITKLAHIHFPVAEPYRRRVLQLGENPTHVFNFGAPGLDHLSQTHFLSREKLREKLNIEFAPLNFLVTYHPETAQTNQIEAQLVQLFTALDDFTEANLFFTKSNADEGGRLINALIDRYVASRVNAYSFCALGTPTYLSLAKQMNVVIGNSSSGLIEIPLLGVPTVNVGARQHGRLLADSVICCALSSVEIVNAVQKTQAPQFLQKAHACHSPYGRGGASLKIKNKLKELDLTVIQAKTFIDLHIAQEHNHATP